MSSLTTFEKRYLEKALDMKTGYVLGFSNPSFKAFFLDVLGIDIYDRKYSTLGDSKANRMRVFWTVEEDLNVAKLLYEYFSNIELFIENEIPIDLLNKILEIIYRLNPSLREGPIPEHEIAFICDISYLRERFEQIKLLPPQPRGFAFEKFLNELFTASNMEPRNPFKLVGEQIDGSFTLDNETYLLEAKWTEEKIGAADLNNFHVKIDSKSKWSRGMFVSMSGFSDDGLKAFSKGKPTNMIGFNYEDLGQILYKKFPLQSAIRLKIRNAAEEGHMFVPLSELI